MTLVGLLYGEFDKKSKLLDDKFKQNIILNKFTVFPNLTELSLFKINFSNSKPLCND